MTEPPQWMSTQAVADHLGITPRTLYRLIEDGQLSPYRIGRVIRLKRDEVEAFIESARVRTGTLKHLYPDARDAAGGDEDA